MVRSSFIACVALAATACLADDAALVLAREPLWVAERPSGPVEIHFEMRNGRLVGWHRSATGKVCEAEVVTHGNDGYRMACQPAWHWRAELADPVWKFRGSVGAEAVALRPAWVVPTGRAPGH